MTGGIFTYLALGSLLIGLLPFAISAIGLTCLYAVVPNCQVPFRHALIGGVFAASTFTLARMLFTAVMAQSSYTLVYGAFAAVPLFLLWIYVTWIIVLIGAVLTHSLSAYQTTEQAQTPTLMKALDILYLFWRAQADGRGIAELEIIRANDLLPGGIDADSWRNIRDTLIAAQLLKRLDRGHYLLSRDLHGITLAELARLIHAEPDFRQSAACPALAASGLCAAAHQSRTGILAAGHHPCGSVCDGAGLRSMIRLLCCALAILLLPGLRRQQSRAARCGSVARRQLLGYLVCALSGGNTGTQCTGPQHRAAGLRGELRWEKRG